MELHWGVHDVLTLEQYSENLLGSRLAIPRILKLFSTYDTHATWAIVGMLYCKDKESLLNKLATLDLPYERVEFSPKHILPLVGENEEDDPFHYANSLIEKIKEVPNQEIATHTFSHYYCLEAGQQIDHFEKDLQAVMEVQQGVTSLIFPRNQTNNDYLNVCKKFGINAFRGNEDSWIYRPYTSKTNLSIKRALRLLDAYINLTGHHTYSLNSIKTQPIINVKSSRFLRPYNKQFKVLEKARLNRIKNSLTLAAKTDTIYHLWWHPHNFGRDMEENLMFLEEILKHVVYLKKNFAFESLHMRDVTNRILEE